MAASAQMRMIRWTFVLVLVFGAGTVASMLEPPPQPGKSEAPKGSLRGPASLPMSLKELSQGSTAEEVPLDEHNQFQAIDLKLGCPNGKDGKSKDGGTFADSVRQLRLSGESCVPGDEIASTEIVNSTNGFSATVFHPSPKTFLTDYISLAKGPNRLRILHIYKKGARIESEYLVGRASDQH